jgi:hypothetical protein
MKNLIISFGLLFLFGSISAQKKYTYLKDQLSHFNGEFNESRYIDIDSISDVYYMNELFINSSYLTQTPFDEISGFIPTRFKYTLIKKSTDGLTDSLRIYNIESSDQYEECVKKYSGEALSYSSHIVHYPTNIDSTQNKYEYDNEGRIFKIIKTYSSGKNITKDTTVFDYDLKQFAPELQYNTIYKNNDSIMVFYNDSGYVTIQEFPDILSIPHYVDTTRYVFDSQSRLIKLISTIEVLSDDDVYSVVPRKLRGTLTIEYKYTDNGYEVYENEMKKLEYKFQSDGYCTDIIEYETSDRSVYPPLYKIVSIEKFSYFKNGEVIVDNGLFENVIPKLYSIQGAVVVNTEKPLPVSIYSLSGSLVKQEKVSAGNTTIPLSKGLYIVVIGNMSYKIFIR